MEYIESFKDGQHVIGHYMCKDKQMMMARKGKNYYKLVLEDRQEIHIEDIVELRHTN